MEYYGEIACQGLAMGKIAVLQKQENFINKQKTTDVNTEIIRLQNALEKSKKELIELTKRAKNTIGDTSASIFEAHQMILEDEEFVAAIYDRISSKMTTAEYAVFQMGEEIYHKFLSMDDSYFQARAEDVKDVVHRLLQNLKMKPIKSPLYEEPVILVAEELTPSEMMQIDQKNILAFVIRKGDINSHTAILARMMNLPALVNVPFHYSEISTGISAIVDAVQGKVIFEPSKEMCIEMESKIHKQTIKQQELHDLKGKKTVTKTGRKIAIYTNISSEDEVAAALENDAEGIGLFRSEFLYMGRMSFPTEEEQFQVYKNILQQMGEKQVTIRTLDIGSDKKEEYFELKDEENPALGCRGIRFCLEKPEIFKIQLRALLRASVYGNLEILYPMITAEEEIDEIHKILEEVVCELKEETIPYKIPKQGVMIETPAAVIISDILANKVDFFSIGTNDLTQYTLAVDRQNSKYTSRYNGYHPAILRMIRHVVKEAHKKGKPVGICGDLAGDIELTEQFLNIGIDVLSVVPSMVLKLRKRVRDMA